MNFSFPPGADEPRDDGGRPRVLIVEDNVPLREILATLLEARYEVETAENGESAIAHVQQTGADVVVLDIMMPVADGRFFMLCLLAQELAVPVIAMSARLAMLRDARRLGVADTLHKPFRIRDLESKIDLLVGPAQA